jgi:DNA-directed RNA polymerase sigma subunit (sigma70/sigma32)
LIEVQEFLKTQDHSSYRDTLKMIELQENVLQANVLLRIQKAMSKEDWFAMVEVHGEDELARRLKITPSRVRAISKAEQVPPDIHTMIRMDSELRDFFLDTLSRQENGSATNS